VSLEGTVMATEHVFYLIHRAGRWQVYDRDATEPLAVQDSAAAAAQWCRGRVGPDAQPVLYSGIWHPQGRRSA
jgi:hypothetical protein